MPEREEKRRGRETRRVSSSLRLGSSLDSALRPPSFKRRQRGLKEKKGERRSKKRRERLTRSTTNHPNILVLPLDPMPVRHPLASPLKVTSRSLHLHLVSNFQLGKAAARTRNRPPPATSRGAADRRSPRCPSSRATESRTAARAARRAGPGRNHAPLRRFCINCAPRANCSIGGSSDTTSAS